MLKKMDANDFKLGEKQMGIFCVKYKSSPSFSYLPPPPPSAHTSLPPHFAKPVSRQ
jgi:hypothetical protein